MNTKDIKGLGPDGVNAVKTVFYNLTKYEPEETYHHTVNGAWFLVYNHTTCMPTVIDGNTTISQLMEVFGK